MPVITSNAAFPLVLGDELAKTWCVPKNDPKIIADRISQLFRASLEEQSALGQRLREIVVRDHHLQALASKLLIEIYSSKKR